jgi:hypothetical protein
MLLIHVLHSVDDILSVLLGQPGGREEEGMGDKERSG